MTYIGVTPGWIVRNDQGRIISAIEETPAGAYQVHAVKGARRLGIRVGEDEALDLAGARRSAP